MKLGTKRPRSRVGWASRLPSRAEAAAHGTSGGRRRWASRPARRAGEGGAEPSFVEHVPALPQPRRRANYLLMSLAELPQIQQLTDRQKLELIEEIWDSIESASDDAPLAPWQQQKRSERLAPMPNVPVTCSGWTNSRSVSAPPCEVPDRAAVQLTPHVAGGLPTVLV